MRDWKLEYVLQNKEGDCSYWNPGRMLVLIIKSAARSLIVRNGKDLFLRPCLEISPAMLTAAGRVCYNTDLWKETFMIR